MLSRLSQITLLSVTILIATSDHAAGVIKTWINPGTGTWEGEGNWNFTSPPRKPFDSGQINNGGTAIVNDLAFNDPDDLSLGKNLGDSGYVSIEQGPIESGLLFPNRTFVGLAGVGQITISGGGELRSSFWTSLGVDATGVGTITVTDGTLMPSTTFIIGDAGTGILNLENGALAISAGTTLGNLMGSNGTATVQGSWTIRGPLVIGNGGSGEVTLDAGSLVASDEVATPQKITIGGQGILRLGTGGMPGLLLASELENNGVLQFNSSTPTTNYSLPIYGTGELLQDGSGLTNLFNANGFSGSIQVNNGALRITGSVLDLRGEEIRVSGGAMEYENVELGEALLRGPGLHYVVNNGASSFSDIETLPSFSMIQDGPTNFELFVNRGYLQSNHVTNVDGFWNASSGQIEVNSDMNIQDFSHDGIITVNNAASLNNFVTNLTAGGGSRTTVAAGGTLNILGSTTMELNGALLVNNGTMTGTVNVNYGSLAKGTGTYDVVNVNEGGQFAPGTSPGITMASSLTLDNSPFASGAPRLVMELAGTTVGTTYDQLQVSGQLSLGGTLDVVLIPGFTPTAGNAFDLLEWGTLVGTFNTLNLPSLSPGLAWNTSQLYNTGVLSVVGAGLPGDFDLDGDVDGRDFLVWQRGGSPTPLGAADLAAWQNNYGAMLAAVSRAIPEPEALMLLSAAIMILGCLPRRAREFN